MKKTVKGVHLDLNPGVFTDIMTLEMLSDVMTPVPDGASKEERAEAEAVRIKSIFRLSRRIYGDQFEAAYNQLAEKNGGYVSADEWSKFVTKTIDVYQKNPDARPASSGK